MENNTNYSNSSTNQYSSTATQDNNPWGCNYDISNVDLLSAEPVVKIREDLFLPKQGKTFIDQISDYFKKVGGKAKSVFGDVVLDKEGAQADKAHGMSRIKAASFAAIKSVLKNGIVVLPLDNYGTNGKLEKTGMIAASIQIGDEKYICVVEVRQNLQTNSLYVHEAFLTKNLQEVVAASNAVHDGNNTTSRQPKGDIANVIYNYLKSKKLIDYTQPSEFSEPTITESKTNKNMKKNTIKLNESQLRKVIAESVKKTLEEGDEKRQIYVSFRDYLEKRCEAAYKNRLSELAGNDISGRDCAFIKEGIALAKSAALDAFAEYIDY